MTTTCETALPGAEPEWRVYAGAEVAVHVAPGCSSAERAPEELREAEQIIDALRRLLAPTAEHAGCEVNIYLAEVSNGSQEGASKSSSNGDLRARHEEDEAAQSVLRIVHSDTSGRTLARQLAQLLIVRWFGTDATAAAMFVEGIAGLAAAHSGIGPSIEEADHHVQSELEAGRSVYVVARRGNGRSTPAADDSTTFHAAATSFLAFLVKHSGPEALRNYLSAYDPARQDQAAHEAYHQPLAVLEEEWLTKLRRRVGEGDTLRTFLRYVWPLLKPYKWKQLEILVYLLLAAGYNIVQPYAVKIVIDRLTEQVSASSGTMAAESLFLRTLSPFLLLLLAIYLINGVVSLRRTYTVNWLHQNILNSLQVRMYGHLQQLSHSYYVKAKIGDLMARLNSDLDNVQSALSQVTNKALYRLFTVVGALTALVMLTRKSPEMAIPILLIIPLFGATYVGLRTRNKQASREQRHRVGQTMATVQEHLAAHAVIKAFGMEDRFISDYRSGILALQKSKLRLAMLSALTDLSEDMTTGLAQLIVFGVGGYLVLRDHNQGLGVGDLAALLVLVKSIFSPIASLSGIGQTMQQATGSVERISELFLEPVTIADKPGAVSLPSLSRGIRFDNVTIGYGQSRRAVRNLTLTIPAGAHVAIVGPSGAGKSTMVNLLLRFWDPERGRILFDGHDLRDVTLASLRGQIGLVFQETFIFNTTVRANIAIGRPAATDEEIAAAAKAARLDGFIASLPAGYDTVPGENGACLSVGQKQRIAIARTFLRNPPILILDEATSALDAKTEAGILETLSELAKGRTTVSITHRISQAAAADLILVMNGGRLVEQGTHSELANAGGLYQKLYQEATGFVTNGVQP